MIKDKTLIKRIEELSQHFIKIGVYYQNLAFSLKNSDKKDKEEIRNFVLKRLSLVKEFTGKIKDLK